MRIFSTPSGTKIRTSHSISSKESSSGFGRKR
jgi:hypothetical protein